MNDVGIGIVWIFFLLTIMGIGPALYCTRYRLDLSVVIAPMLSVMLITLLGVYLIQFDLPVKVWGFPLTGLILMLSLTVTLFVIQSKKIIYTGYSKKERIIYVSGLLATIILLILPIMIGGLAFTVLRGNGTDTFNYISLADYLWHEPFSWANQVSLAVLSAKKSSYLIAHMLLSERWSTSMLMAWASLLTGIPLYRFEYGFTVLFFILTYSISFIFARKMELNPILALLTALALAMSFWAQLVLDIRAVSQIIVIPLELLAILIFSSLSEKNQQTEVSIREQILLGCLLTVIALLYIEIIPLILLALLFYTVLQVKHRSISFLGVYRYRVTLLVVAITFIPTSQSLLEFLYRQIKIGLVFKNRWDQAYFNWLYQTKLVGFWGFYPLSHFATLNMITHVFLTLVSIVLTLILLYALSCLIRKPLSVLLTITGCSLLASFTIFLSLAVQDQRWAAGKNILYGYPFLILFMVGMLNQIDLFKLNRAIKSVMIYSILAWLIIQCNLVFLHIDDVFVGKFRNNSIENHGEYMMHDWNFSNIIAYINKNKINNIGILVQSDWVAEYLGLILDRNIKITYFDAVGRFQDGITKTVPRKIPDYVIVNKKAVLHDGMYLAENNEYGLMNATNLSFDSSHHIKLVN